MSSEKLLEHLRSLETELHQPEVRSNTVRLDKLLHEAFTEIGQSGRRYTRDEIIDELAVEKDPGKVLSENFTVQQVSAGVAILTYSSAHVDANGKESQRTHRSSLWQETPKGWQIRFHQGTAAKESA